MEWHNFIDVLLRTLQRLWLQLLSSHRKQKDFMWIEECQKVWVLIKHEYIAALILIPLN